MLKQLKPIAEDHSIFRAIATIFIPQIFLKPEDVLEKSKNNEGFSIYPKKSLAQSTTINIKNNSLGISNDQINGFVFENYREDGAINNIFRLENKENRSLISFETRNYLNWKLFKEQLNKDLISFSNDNEFYVDALSLNYRDEFIWKDNSNIPVDNIFDKDSELINKKFLSSRNGTLILISQGVFGTNFKTEEKTEISFNNDIKRVIIDHQFAVRFSSYQLFNKLNASNKIEELFDKAHTENKNVLKNVLTNEVQELIKLK